MYQRCSSLTRRCGRNCRRCSGPRPASCPLRTQRCYLHPYLAAFRHEERQATERRKDPRGVPSTEQSITQGSSAKSMAFAHRQVVHVREVEDMFAVEQRRPVIDIREIAIRVDSCLILVRDVLIQRLGESIGCVERQPVRGSLPQGCDQTVVVRLADVCPHMQVEELPVLECWQSKAGP